MITTLTLSEKRRLLKRTARRGNVQEKILKEPSLLIVDLFCGAGGVTTGFALSGIAKILACINHDHNAIISHWANHPWVKHFEEDMRTLALERLIAIVEVARLLHPDAKLVLWASLECTNFSKAKGGMARDADSRTLADHLHRYITALNPDYVMIENVVEFKEWGPMRIKCKAYHEDRCDLHVMKKKTPKKGKRKKGQPPVVAAPVEMVYGWMPVPETKGQDYKRWCKEVCDRGYEMEWREMNSADFGAYTSRNRLFGLFVKPGLNKIWPEKTHSKAGVTQAEWNKFW